MDRRDGGRPARKPRALNAAELHGAMLRRCVRRSKASGSLTLPAVPALLDHYTDMIDRIISAVGRPFTKSELADVRALLAEKIHWAFARSQNAWIVVEYASDPDPKMSLSYSVTGWHKPSEERYAEWTATREGPLFGAHPDARVMDLARTLGAPAEVTCLDVGAGTGRNAIPLARAGHPVDALEPAPALADLMEAATSASQVELRVLRGSLFEPTVPLRNGGYRLVVLAETSTHWRGLPDLHRVFARLADVLAPDGVALMNLFVASSRYTPNALARQLSEILWCPLFTREDLERAQASLPLELVTDEAVLAYEKEHLPREAWPPTRWFEEWTDGLDLFDVPAGEAPMELRWLAYRRS